MELVSQSEADSYLSCTQKHYYAFGEPNSAGSRGIAPKEHGEALTRGTVGHEGLSVYYNSRIQGASHEDAKRAAIIAVSSYDTSQTEIKAEVVRILGAYFDFYGDEMKQLKPLAIEREFRYPIPDSGIIFPFKPDAIMQDTSTGKVYVWDHKLIYNYYPERVYPLMPQMQKYALALQRLGFRVDGYLYNMLSTRKNAKEPFRRVPLPLKPTAEKYMEDQIRISKLIIHMKSLPNDVWASLVIRNASSFSCSKCPFLDICAIDHEEKPGRKLHVETFYEPNTYRYEGKEEENV